MKYVNVYSKDNCPQCKMVKRWLNDKSITYTESNITTNPKEGEYLKSLGFISLPITHVKTDTEEEYIKGFDIKKLTELLLKD